MATDVARMPAGGSAAARPAAAAPSAAHDDSDVHEYRWLILLGLITAAIMEVLDTTIVNVALPQMAGNLGATYEEIAWVATGYILSNVVVLPMTAFFTATFGRQELPDLLDHAVRGRVVPVRHVAHAGRARALAHRPGRGRRGAALDRAGDAPPDLPARAAGHGAGASSSSASSSRRRSARRSAGGSPTTTPGTGASSSTSRSPSRRRSSSRRFLHDPPGHKRTPGAIDWLGIGLLTVGLGVAAVRARGGQAVRLVQRRD